MSIFLRKKSYHFVTFFFIQTFQLKTSIYFLGLQLDATFPTALRILLTASIPLIAKISYHLVTNHLFELKFKFITSKDRLISSVP